MEVVVFSSAFAPSPELRRRCELSVLTQTVEAQHIYIDARFHGGTGAENVFNTVHTLDPETIVLWLDGDDWLPHERCVERILQEYKRGAWLTFGSYVVWDQAAIRRAPEAKRQFAISECRKDVWYASHLKTFRAGLFQRIRQESLMTPHPDPRQGHEWMTECIDLATMWPMLEMAGTEKRARHIQDCLYVYNYTNPRSVHNIGGPRLEYQTAEARRLRTLKPYNRLEKSPW